MSRTNFVSYPSDFYAFKVANRNTRVGLIIHNATDDIVYVLLAPGVATMDRYSIVLASNATVNMGKGEYNGTISVLTVGVGTVKVTEIFE